MSHVTARPAIRALLIPISAVVLVKCSHPTSPSDRTPASAAADVSSAADMRNAENGARRASDAEVQAFLANDPVALARLWSNEFVVTNPFNQFADKQQVLALVTSGTLAFSAYSRTVDYAHAYGKLVILAGRETVVWAGRLPLTGQTSNLRYTAVWMRDGDGWQEIARHANIIQPPPKPTS